MKERPGKSAFDQASRQLRQIVMETDNGGFIGSEEALLQRIGCARTTLRQVARLLEQDGLLKVKRGIGGGYYAARPDARAIERVVSAYLESVDFQAQDVTTIASVLWVEVVRKAAAIGGEQAITLAAGLRKKVLALKPTASFSAVRAIERESQKAVLSIVKSRYIELIFDINIAFASRTFPSHDIADDSEQHTGFVKAWREAKLIELAAIAEGNVEMGAMAAKYVRTVWQKRIWLE